jgi:ribosome-binding factor A
MFPVAHLLDVRVERVEPTGDDSRFVVLFAVEGDAAQRSSADLLASLEMARPALLREVAATISRRKLPDLAFQIVLCSDARVPGSHPALRPPEPQE